MQRRVSAGIHTVYVCTLQIPEAVDDMNGDMALIGMSLFYTDHVVQWLVHTDGRTLIIFNPITIMSN